MQLKIVTVDGRKMFKIRDRIFGKKQANATIASIVKQSEAAGVITAELKKDKKLNLTVHGLKIIEATIDNFETRSEANLKFKKDIETLMPDVDDDPEEVEA